MRLAYLAEDGRLSDRRGGDFNFSGERKSLKRWLEGSSHLLGGRVEKGEREKEKSLLFPVDKKSLFLMRERFLSEERKRKGGNI